MKIRSPLTVIGAVTFSAENADASRRVKSGSANNNELVIVTETIKRLAQESQVF